jgi:hypothetical protein
VIQGKREKGKIGKETRNDEFVEQNSVEERLEDRRFQRTEEENLQAEKTSRRG